MYVDKIMCKSAIKAECLNIQLYFKLNVFSLTWINVRYY